MKEHTFVSLLKDVINKLENGEILNNGKKLNYSTIKSYKGVYNTMKRYKFNFDIENLDLNSVVERRKRIRVKKSLQGKVNKYLNLLTEDCKHPNTRKSHLKTIRATLKKGEEEYGYWFPKLQSVKELQTEVIAMNPEEVELIHTAMPIDQSLHTTWYYTRLMLYSCMRISDLVGFECDTNSDSVTIITKKGSGSISNFYLPQDVKDYIVKTKWKLDIVTFRRNLKKLLQQYDAFCINKVTYEYDFEGNPKKETHKLWELYTPHKLRSSGITYYLSKGLTEMEVREISGHANGSEAFYRYVKFTNTSSIQKQKEMSHLLTNEMLISI
tara:strand:+ start:3528 stop:4505 length:978 start_codon:yes stop_codon:yes gene_type:complete